MKRVITCILTFALLLSVCLFAVSAQGTGSLTMTSAEGKQGDTITVDVNLASNPGLITMKFAIGYPDDLELTAVQNSGLLNGWTTPAPTVQSPYTIRWADSLSTTNNTATGKILTLTFKIKDDATPGEQTISLTFNESRDAVGARNTFENASATVTVKCKSHIFGNYSSLNDTQHVRTCTACGFEEKSNHGFGAWAPSGSNHTRTCTDCNHPQTGDHRWNSGVVTTPANCKDPGTKTFTCLDCGAEDPRPIDVTEDHVWGNWVKLDDTNHKRTCSVCEKPETAAHRWNNGVVTTPANCKDPGTKTFTCLDCGAEDPRPIDVTEDHVWGNWENLDETNHKRICSVCEKPETAAHAKGNKLTAGETTHWYLCACGIKMEETDHAYDETKWASDDDNHWHTCACGAKSEAVAHSWDEGKVTTAATTKKEGVKTFTCKDCADVKTEKLPKLETPSTGDNTMILPFVLLMILSAAGVAVTVIGKKRAAR